MPKQKRRPVVTSDVSKNSQTSRLITRHIAETGSREVFLQVTLRETIFYVIFLIIATILAVGMVFPSMYYLTKSLQEQFVEKEFFTGNNLQINFANIHSASDFWFYAESVLLNGFYSNIWNDKQTPSANSSSDDDDDDDKTILYKNKLLGVPRIRQLKVRNDSCVIHDYFRLTFLNCYDVYSSRAEDTQPFGLKDGTAWTYSTSLETGSATYTGKMAYYDGGGFYQDLAAEKNSTENILKELKKNLWIRRGTRVIFVDFTVFNANLNLFCVMKIIFEFPPTGGVFPSYSFQTLKPIRYNTTWDYFVMTCEIIFLVFVGLYTLQEVRDIVYFRWKYLKYFWSYVNLILLSLSYTCLALSLATSSSSLEKLVTLETEYANFEDIVNSQISFNNLVAVLLFMIYVRLFQYLGFNKTMGQLSNTLHRCAWNVLGFSIMFFIIFIAFTELGYLLFGTQVEGYSSFGFAMFTLLRTILGDFDYLEIENANRILAPLFFLLYIFFVFFILLNMFLAIINDTYSDVKTEISIKPQEMQLWEYIKLNIFKLLQRCGCCTKYWSKSESLKGKNESNIVNKQIHDALKKCGFSDSEMESFFTRYNIDPTAEMGEYDIKKLMSDLEGSQINRKVLSTEPPPKRDKKTAGDGVAGFIAQQERYNRIEENIVELASKVDELLKKLDVMDNVRKKKL